MPHAENPVTIRTLATQLRISAMTVSRALRNVAGVSPATRKLVLNAAEQRGYRPDPSLAVLNAYRRGKRHLHPTETIAYISNFSSAEEWRGVTTFARYFHGVQSRAKDFGYAVEHFWLGGPDLTDRRASQILSSRGIRGLIIGPLGRAATSLNLDWSQFATVALGRSLSAPALTTVSTHHAQAVELVWQKALARKFKRIGLVLTEEEEARTAGALHAAHFVQQKRHPENEVPVLITPDFSGPALAKWVKQYEPQVILGSNIRHQELLIENLGPGIRGIHFIHLNVNPRSEMAGIDQGHDRVGAAAVTLLHQKLLRRELGIPLRREMTLIDGSWKEGRGQWRLGVK